MNRENKSLESASFNDYDSLIEAIASAHQTTQSQAVQAVNLALTSDPQVLKFLDSERKEFYTESQLKAVLLDQLQRFFLERWDGFCFIARQRRVTFDNEHYYIDLLLYNRRLKCLFAIDLILGHFRHEYAGAMNFYLNYLKSEETEPDENPPVGLILCSDKNETHVEYAIGGLSNQVFVSRYLLNLPSEQELTAFIQQQRREIEDRLESSLTEN